MKKEIMRINGGHSFYWFMSALEKIKALGHPIAEMYIEGSFYDCPVECIDIVLYQTDEYEYIVQIE